MERYYLGEGQDEPPAAEGRTELVGTLQRSAPTVQDLRQHIAECRPKFHRLAISEEDRTNYQLQVEGLAEDERTELGRTILQTINIWFAKGTVR